MSDSQNFTRAPAKVADQISMVSFGQSLKHLMKERGLSVRKLTEQTNIPKSTIAEWLSGRSPKFSPELIKLSQVLGVSLETLLVGKSTEEQIIEELVTNKEKFIQIFKGVYRITVEKENK